MGSPKTLTTAQIAELKILAADQPESEETIFLAADGRIERTFALRSNDIYFITLKK